MSIFLTVLFVCCANHCLFEEFAESAFNKWQGIEHVLHSEHHAGAEVPHKHDDSNVPHEHGQPHEPIFLRLETVRFEFSKLLLLVTPFMAFVLLFAVKLSDINLAVSIVRPVSRSRYEDKIHLFLRCLCLAPQAPPANL